MSEISDIGFLSDKAILQKIGLFVQQTRIKQNLTQEDLATQAAISRSTLSLIERGDNSSIGNLIKLLRCINSLYVLSAFELHEELSPMQIATGEKQQRQRASKVTRSDSHVNDLGW